MFYLEPVPANLKVDDNNIEIPTAAAAAAAAEKVSSVKVHTMEDTSTIAAKCDPERTTLKRELILQ